MHRPVFCHRSGFTARAALGMALFGLAFLLGCLDDTPVTSGRPMVRAMLHANIVGAAAVGGSVQIRVGYRTRSQQFIALPSSPEQITVAPGTTVVIPVTVDIGPCLADDQRAGAGEPGCLLAIELTLTDAAGQPIDSQTREAGGGPATPGEAVDFGTVTIGVTVSSVVVAPASLGMSVSDEQRVTATVRDASGAAITTVPVTWTTSDATVAQLNATTGASVTVRALKLGNATVSASAGGRASNNVAVSVVPPAPLTIRQRQGAGCVIVAQTINLDVDTPPAAVTWASANTGIATVGATSGVVTGVSSGQSIITATSGSRTGTATVCVTGPLRVATTTVSITAGRTVQLNVTGTSGGTVSYSSNATGIATVDANGLIRGVGVGQATITVRLTAASGTESVAVTVTVSPAGLAVSPTSASASVNTTARFAAVVLDANGATIPGVPVTWSIADATIGSLSATTGTTVDVRALGLGTTIVRATIGTVTASAQFTATPQLPAARLEKVSGDGASCPTRSTGCVFVVRAVDASGSAVANATVSWASNAACGPAKIVATNATGLATLTNICSNVAAGAYTQSATLTNNQSSVSFAFTLRGLVLTLQTITSFGNYVYNVTSPSPASGLTLAVDYVSGPGANYVTLLELNRTFTPAVLTVGYSMGQLPFAAYTFDVIVSTNAAGIGPGTATISFGSDSGGFNVPPSNRRTVRATPQSMRVH